MFILKVGWSQSFQFFSHVIVMLLLISHQQKLYANFVWLFEVVVGRFSCFQIAELILEFS
jgi:hypothetical protein